MKLCLLLLWAGHFDSCVGGLLLSPTTPRDIGALTH